MNALAKESVARPYIQYCTEVFFTPRSFFQQHFRDLSLSKVLSFGVLTVWLSSIVLFVYDSALLLFFSKYFGSTYIMSSILNFGPTGKSEAFIQEVSLLLLNPYFTLLYLLLLSFGIFASAKIFAPYNARDKINFKSCLKIFSVAAMGAWFAIIPIMGVLLNYVVGFLLLTTGIKEVFGVSTIRSLVIVLAPQIILITLITSLLGLTLLIIAAKLASEILQVL